MVSPKNIGKLIVSAAYDYIDFTLGHIPVVDTVIDVLGTGLAVYLWGVPGLAVALEILEPTGQIDSFIPSLTIIGIYKTFTEDA